MIKVLFLILSVFLVADSKINEKLRKDSYPFISGDSFRLLAQHKLESDSPIHITQVFGFIPGNVKAGDIVFVEGSLLKIFFKQYHKKIRNKYILITHNADESCPREFFEYLNDPKIAVWFTTNMDCRHSKLIPIPIGFSNSHWPHSRKNHVDVELKQKSYIGPILEANKQFIHWRLLRKPRKHLLYVNFHANTNPRARKEPQEIFYNLNHSYVLKETGRRYDLYLGDMLDSVYTISPPGNGFDCHRAWEAMSVGSIPVMMTTPIDSLFNDLPVLIINDWKMVTKEFLEKRRKEILSKEYNYEKLYMNYWKDLILTCKNNLS